MLRAMPRSPRSPWGSETPLSPLTTSRARWSSLCAAVAVPVAVAVPIPVAVATVVDRGGRGGGGRLDDRGGRGGWRVAVGHGDRPRGVGRDLAVRPGGGGVHGHGGIEPERQAERPGGDVRGGVEVVGGREVVHRGVSQPPGLDRHRRGRLVGHGVVDHRQPSGAAVGGGAHRQPGRFGRGGGGGWDGHRQPQGDEHGESTDHRVGPPHHRGLVPVERGHPSI